MLVIINAMKSIIRSKARNILIGIIVLAIAASSCVALAIRNAANEAEEAGIDSINITGTITVDRHKLMQEAQSGGRGDMNAMRELMAKYPELSLKELLGYSESDYVKGFYYSGSMSLDAVGELEAYSTESSDNNNNGGSAGNKNPSNGPVYADRPGGAMVIGGMAMGDFTLTGYSSEDAMTKFMNGTSKITDGSMFDTTANDMNCLISKELAAFNSFSVGDKIKLANPNKEDETYEFTIIGIYADSSSGESDNMPRFGTAMDPANLICISYESLKTINENSEAVATTQTDNMGNERSTALNGQLAGTFVFSNVESYENFCSELKAKGLSEYYTVNSTDINNYESSLKPLKDLSSYATTLLLIVLAIGAVILIVINIFNIRERKYEVGVLTAVGIKKGKVAMQFVTELLCVTLLAIIIGTAVGSAASVPVSKNLLISQIEQTIEKNKDQNESFGRPGSGPHIIQGGSQGGVRTQSGPMMSTYGRDESDYFSEINAAVNFTIMGQLIGIGIILTLISSLAAVVFVMRYEPLKILANRS